MTRDSSDPLSHNLWVGEIATDADILVYDGRWQPKMPEKVRLYSATRDAWRTFLPDIVRRQLRRLTDANTIRSAVEAYSVFEAGERAREAQLQLVAASARARRATEYKEWVANESQRRRERTLDLHQDHLRRHGLSNAEYRERADFLPERAPHCWACRQPLDSRQDIEHTLCGWLVCACGACGCGFPGLLP